MHINRNMSAVITNNQLLRTENKLSASMERLSSGFKINHASDNPAGIAISNKMKAQIDALNQAEANASDGVSVLQIADGALSEVTSILQRMRELSVQAANGTNSYDDKKSIQAEIDELKKEVDRISSDTEYNTKTLLDGSSDVRVYAEGGSRFYVSEAVDAKDYAINVNGLAEQASIELDYAAPTKDGTILINGVSASIIAGMTKEEYLHEIRTAAEEAGCYVEIDDTQTTLSVKSEHYGYDAAIEFSVTKDLADELAISNDPAAVYDAETETYVLNVNGIDADVTLPTDTDVSGFTATTTINADGNRITITDSNGFSIDFLLDENYVPVAADSVNGNYEIEVTDIGSLTIQIGSNEHQTMDVRITEISVKSLYLDTVDVTVVNGAEKAMITLDEAMTKLTATRSRIGAFQNRLDYATASLSETSENVTTAYSGLMDTDMAIEMSEYSQLNVLNQASISVLAQANEMPQQILSLLQR
ncbi:MAG: flagellin [Agathobacter sp.]